MSDETRARRALVATDHRRCPATALALARAAVGADGEVVVAAVVVVPVVQPLDAHLERSLTRACDTLEECERQAVGAVDSRLVRARTFAKGVLETLAAEPFDLVLIEEGREQLRGDAGGQIAALIDKADATVILIRPRPAADVAPRARSGSIGARES